MTLLRARSPFVLWAAFVLVHGWLGWQGFTAEALPYGDVSFVYTFWAHQAVAGGAIVGIDTQWVYPILALIPIVIPTLGGLASTAFYPYGWMLLVALIDALAFGFLIGSWNRRTHPAVARSTVRTEAAWWWLAMLVCLGPVSVARIDSIATPIALVGLVFAITRPAVASTLLTLAAWIKVWPAALVATLWVAGRQRARVVIYAGVTSVSIVAIAVVVGAGGNVFSFLTQQTGRGLQVESPASTLFVWLSAAHVPGFAIYYDQALLTFQVLGAGADIVAMLSTVVLVVIALLVLGLGLDARRHGAVPLRVLGPVALAMTTALIAFNKVGSPQFIGWLAVPIVFGLILDRRRFHVPALIALTIALLTQGFYPYLYLYLLNLNPWMVALLSVRNLLEFVLLGYAVVMVARLRAEARARKVRHTAEPSGAE